MATVGTVIALQWIVIFCLAAVAWMLGGVGSAQSLVLGGAAVALPNTILASWLTVRLKQGVTSGVVAMLGGELVKLACTVVLLVAIATKLKGNLAGLALIVGVVGALKAQWLALWFTRRY